MKKIADLSYLLEISANMTMSPYFDSVESDSDVCFAKFVNPRVLLGKQVEKQAKNAKSEEMYCDENAVQLWNSPFLTTGMISTRPKLLTMHLVALNSR